MPFNDIDIALHLRPGTNRPQDSVAPSRQKVALLHLRAEQDARRQASRPRPARPTLRAALWAYVQRARR